MTRLNELKKLAEKVRQAKGQMQLEDALYDFRKEVNPQTIMQMIALIGQMGAALKHHTEMTRPIHQTIEALAEYEKFNKGE